MSKKLQTKIVELLAKELTREAPLGIKLEDVATKIEQAFKDAGYSKTPTSISEFTLTGKEWFERFEKETKGAPGRHWYPDEWHDAAKRAAGILESEKVTDAELFDPKNIANLSQTYGNDDTAFQAEEIHPIIVVDNEPAPLPEEGSITYIRAPGTTGGKKMRVVDVDEKDRTYRLEEVDDANRPE